MGTVSSSVFESNLDELADRVEAGEMITVTHDGQPVFDMVPHKALAGVDVSSGEKLEQGD